MGLMVIGYFNVKGILTEPAEAEAPLVVDADAILAEAIGTQSLEAIAGRQAHDVELIGGVELEKFAAGGALDVWRQAARRDAGKDFFRLGVGEALDHGR